MPEINNQVKKDVFKPTPADPSQKPEKLFELPQRRAVGKKFLLIPVVVIVLAAAGWFGYKQLTKPAAPAVVEQPAAKEEPAAPAGMNFYLTSSNDGKNIINLYRYSDNSTMPDEKIQVLNTGDSNTFYNVLGKWTKPYTYVINNADTEISVLDAQTGKIEGLFEAPDKKFVRNVALSSDNKWLAYGLTTEGTDKGGTSSEVWLYNTETKEQKQLVGKTEMKLYQGFSILGWRDEDKQIIASAVGGDAGAVWGDLYVINVETGEFELIKTPDEANAKGFLTGRLSPDHDRWLYSYCKQFDDTVRQQEGGFQDACSSGAELRTYDFAIKKTNTVYQNLRYDNNVDKSMLRTIMSFLWQDDKTVVAAVPGAMLNISVGSTEKPTEILTYDVTVPQNFRNNLVFLYQATPAKIVYTREDGWHIFDRVSQKITTINTAGNNESIYNWLD